MTDGYPAPASSRCLQRPTPLAAFVSAMISTRKHTHRGHCQACGRIQAVHIDHGTIALHGYTVGNGYFSGTCAGSQYHPLEKKRDRLDMFRTSCLEKAVICDERAAGLRAGKVWPNKVQKYKKKMERSRTGI